MESQDSSINSSKTRPTTESISAACLLFDLPEADQARKVVPPRKQIRKAKLTAKYRIFHGNKVFERQQKLKNAWYGVIQYVRKHEPEIFEEMERERRTGPARDLRAPPSPEESE